MKKLNIQASHLTFYSLLLLLFLCSGCGVKTQGYMGIDANIHKKIDKAVAALLKNEDVEELIGSNSNLSVLVPSVVSINSLEETSPLGLTLAEYIANSMVDRGFLLREIKMTEKLALKEKGGEYLLSRNIEHLSKVQKADLAITGTYAAGQNVVFISLRLSEIQTGVILSTAEVDLPMGTETKALLGRHGYKYN